LPTTVLKRNLEIIKRRKTRALERFKRAKWK